MGCFRPPVKFVGGYYGTGVFTQTGGTNATPGGANYGLFLGSTGGTCTYNLSESGLLSSGAESVGYSGTGVFTQSGGTNSIPGGTNCGLFLGGSAQGCSGTYNLNGGLLNLCSLTYAGGAATFNFSGGTLQASSGFSASLPMTLGSGCGGSDLRYQRVYRDPLWLAFRPRQPDRK